MASAGLTPGEFNTILDNTTGALFLGYLISSALCGVTYAQACVYIKRRWKTDTNKVRSLVVSILCLETLHLILSAHGVWVYTIVDHAQPTLLVKIVWSTICAVLPATIVALIVQFVWIMRIYTLNHSRYRRLIVGSITVSCLVEAGLSIAWVAAGVSQATWTSHEGQVVPILMTSFIVRCINDSTIAALLVYHLRKKRNGFNRTDDMIRTMLTYGLNTGLITCLGSITILILVVTTGTSMYYVAVYMSLTKVYGISLLAILNWRGPHDSRRPSEASAVSSYGMELDTAPIGLFTNASIILPANEDT